jgi:hypothetical protein
MLLTTHKDEPEDNVRAAGGATWLSNFMFGALEDPGVINRGLRTEPVEENAAANS